MTRSASTPRLRLTQGFYAVMTLSSLVAGGAARPAAWSTLLSLVSFLAVAAACLGRIWCSVFIAGRKDIALVTMGPYAWCRHPLYAWSLLAGFGLGLSTQTWTWPILAVGLLTWLFQREMRREDQLLAERHGAAFLAYAARTPALWPRRPAATAPAVEISLRPDLFAKAFLDAGSMLLVFALLTALTALRQAGSLPTVLQIP